MSLAWKKPKSGRISRFMSEFQQSPKRGGSLVVETGFPTSLIDLFVKNRDRLKKSSSKRLQRQTQTAPNASSPIRSPDLNLEKPAKRETVHNKIDKVHCSGGELTAENKHSIDKKGCVCASGVNGSGASVLTAFKVFIVAVLALSTKKKLTLGITLSTFALLLIELVAGRVFTRLKICNTDTKKEKLAVSIHEKNVLSSEKTETFGEEMRVPDSHNAKSISCLEPVYVTEKSNSKDLTIRDLLLKDEKSTSKTSRMKSKIVKKLKSFKKKKKETVIIKEESLTERSSLVSEDKSEIIETKRDEKESNRPLVGSKGINTNGIVVIVIVLTGLLSGKILAIVLTLSCLLLRFGADKNSGRYI